MAEYKLLLPAMGESVDEATVTQWLKNEGDIIEADDAVVEIATDKVDSEVPSEISGKLLKKLVDENQVVRVGEPLAIIQTEEEPPEEETEESPTEIPKPTEVKSDFLESKAKEILVPPNPALRITCIKACKLRHTYSRLSKSMSPNYGIGERGSNNPFFSEREKKSHSPQFL